MGKEKWNLRKDKWNLRKEKWNLRKDKWNLRKDKWKLRRRAIAWVLLFSMVLIRGQRVHGATFSYPFVKYSPDGMAWTISEKLPDPKDAGNHVNPSCWYPFGEEVIAMGKKEIPKPQIGEHYYSYNRRGILPIGYWKVKHETAKCIHPNTKGFHGVSGGNGKCHSSYYSGWNPYCADCGELAINLLFYFSRDVAKELKTLDLNKDYYYLCPTCAHMEQGAGLSHVCKGISANRYQIVYLANATDTTGVMEPSLHMYDNVEFFEGERVEAQRTLSPNMYARSGRRFVEWNLMADGSGEGFSDEQAILNLTDENYDPELGTGIVKLYAQWENEEEESNNEIVMDNEAIVDNDVVMEKDIQEFSLEAQVIRMLAPHDPFFQRGESGILRITTKGYATKVEVEWPDALAEAFHDLTQTFVYKEPAETAEEELEFMIPLYFADDGTCFIKVRAYKEEKVLECRPSLSVAGSILEELRTRLR